MKEGSEEVKHEREESCTRWKKIKDGRACVQIKEKVKTVFNKIRLSSDGGGWQIKRETTNEHHQLMDLK